MTINIKNIIIADDDEDDVQILLNALKRIIPSTEIVVVSNGIRLLLQLNKVRPDVVFLDINMPVKNGIEILKEISADAKCSTRIIIYSTSTNKNDIELSYKNGATFYLVKPASFQALHLSLLRLISDHNFLNKTKPTIEEFVVGYNI